jgi:putative transposase
MDVLLGNVEFQHRHAAQLNTHANGCVERFIRTLKEQLLWVKVFRNVEELRCALAEFRECHNHRWIVQRLGYLTPTQARQQLLALGAAA